MLERTFKMPDGNKVSFVNPVFPLFKRYIQCIIETKAKKFYCGIAVVAPNETNIDDKLGMRIALKRACLANPAWNFNEIQLLDVTIWFEKKRFAPEKYKEYWRLIRLNMKESKI